MRGRRMFGQLQPEARTSSLRHTGRWQTMVESGERMLREEQLPAIREQMACTGLEQWKGRRCGE